ncbi:ribonuclease H-like domain-containing protein [Mycena polygramma]|nr:ribonuclease H-like domain-containing protein [Mycena polygramma]
MTNRTGKLRAEFKQLRLKLGTTAKSIRHLLKGQRLSTEALQESPEIVSAQAKSDSVDPNRNYTVQTETDESLVRKQETEAKLPPYPELRSVKYLTSERAVNDALRAITEGVIGFDTEYVGRKLTKDEELIEEIFLNVPGNKRSGILAWQACRARSAGGFAIDWNNAGLCIIQIAKGNDVWLLNMNKIKALPKHLHRVLESNDIVKAGVGISADLPVIWNDLGCDMNNVVDCGLMAKLFLAEKYKETPFANLSLLQSVSDILGYTIDKELQKSNWKGDTKGDITEEQKKYAAIDAHAALRLFEVLVPALKERSIEIERIIPKGWYTYNGRYGFTVRRNKTHGGKEAPWSTADCTWFFGGKFQGYYPYP